MAVRNLEKWSGAAGIEKPNESGASQFLGENYDK